MNLFKIIKKIMIYVAILYMKFLIKKSDDKLIKLKEKLCLEQEYNTKLSQDTLVIIEKHQSIE